MEAVDEVDHQPIQPSPDGAELLGCELNVGGFRILGVPVPAATHQAAAEDVGIDAVLL